MIAEKDYTNPYGTWQVTTEGDCEGKSTRNFGVYVGYLDDIAFALAEKCFYSLEFTKIDGEEQFIRLLDVKEADYTSQEQLYGNHLHKAEILQMMQEILIA